MSEPTPLELSMLADGALSEAEARAVAAKIAANEDSQAALAGMEAEARLLARAFAAPLPTPEIPKFSRPITLRGFALANVATGLVIWMVQFLWKTLFGELVVNVTAWISSIYLPDIYSVASSTTLYLLEEGTAMLDAYLGFVVVFVVALTALAAALLRRRYRDCVSVCLAAMLVGSLAVPEAAHALDVRRSEGTISVPAAETVDDTLIVAAQAITIEGDVTGDLVAAGQSIDIAGDVGGNVIAFGESVTVRGAVGGFVLSAASSVTLDGADVAGDLWASGALVAVDDDATVRRNATVASSAVTIDGAVDKDLFAFSESVAVSGQLGRNLEAFTNRIRLAGDARVAGDVRLRTQGEDSLIRGDGVQIDGELEFLALPEELEPENPYATVSFYLWQVVQIITGLLVGLVLLWLAPGLRHASIGAGIDGLKSAGIGLLALLTMPVAAVLIGATIIGLPFAFVTFALWALGFYLSTILVGAIVGRMVLPDSNSLPMTLLVGLTIVVVITALPWVGDFLGFILTILGLGLLIQYAFSALSSRPDPAAA